MNGTLNLYGDLFAELNRLQDSFEQAFSPDGAGSIRALPRHTFPVINVGSTADAIEVLALAPGVDPAALQITVDEGLLVIAGELKNDGPAQGGHTAVYAQEWFKFSPRNFPARRCRHGPHQRHLPRRHAARDCAAP